MSVEATSIKAVFLAALEKSTPAEREAYLDEACGGDAVLRGRVETLLKAHDQTDPLLDQPAAEHLAGGDEQASLDFLGPSDKPDSLGSLGHYEVLEVVGQGGMGIVLRAFDDKLHRVVAIKALYPLLASDAAARRRFVREAQAAAAVTHDNVISIHAVEDAGQVPYLVMQFIHGCTLQEKIDRGSPLPLKEILRIGLQIAEGLAGAHRQGLVHRDIKPVNILLENGVERVKITDFGLARAVDDASLTRRGEIAGTPAYMSPEQAQGNRVDHRSDLFSLGSVLYTLCIGQPPFAADTMVGVLKRVCEETPRPLREINPDIPEWLDAVIARLQAKDPAERFDSAAEVAALLSRRLAQWQRDEMFSDLEEPADRPVRPQRRPANRWLIAANLLGAALIVVCAAVTGWLAYQSWLADREITAPASQPPPVAQPAAEPAPIELAPIEPVVLKPVRTLRKHLGGPLAVAFAPNGKVLASGGKGRSIYLWDTETWQARGPLLGHAGEVIGLSFSPDSRQLASVTSAPDTCLVRLWNVETAELAATLGPSGLSLWDVEFSPDGKSLACGGWGCKLHVLDVATGTERFAIPDVHEFILRVLSFSKPDGQLVATGGKGPTRLWDAATGEEFRTTAPLPEWMYPVFLAGGQGLAGWNFGEGRVTVCDLPSGEVRAAWRAHPETIEGLATSPDGRFLASVGKEGLARIWSTETFEEVATLIGHEGTVYAAAFTPDGTQLATAGRDDLTIRLWDLPAVCRVRR